MKIPQILTLIPVYITVQKPFINQVLTHKKNQIANSVTI